jgi:DNA-binding PadR family transcriptional regulator
LRKARTSRVGQSPAERGVLERNPARRAVSPGTRRTGLEFEGGGVYSHKATKREPTVTAHSLAEFELLVMLAAIRLGSDEAYTVSIVDDIRERTGRSVRRANVFTALRRLEEKGYVTSRLGDPRPERGGRPPRLVAVEPAGLDAVRATTSAIRAMVGELGPMLGGSR